MGKKKLSAEEIVEKIKEEQSIYNRKMKEGLITVGKLPSLFKRLLKYKNGIKKITELMESTTDWHLIRFCLDTLGETGDKRAAGSVKKMLRCRRKSLGETEIIRDGARECLIKLGYFKKIHLARENLSTEIVLKFFLEVLKKYRTDKSKSLKKRRVGPWRYEAYGTKKSFVKLEQRQSQYYDDLYINLTVQGLVSDSMIEYYYSEWYSNEELYVVTNNKKFLKGVKEIWRRMFPIKGYKK